ncbi:extracellular solute-binding protein [uncultured Paenibacillus sp.]|uniref:extracellular solute-binding protein n=1 Tax=uncultured Paenibacillus sp. TaxID=227322 RepID=UPI0015AC9E80|nr:extracellular solute-binding protein [uncultured Paenibacillus sp.]
MKKNGFVAVMICCLAFVAILSGCSTNGGGSGEAATKTKGNAGQTETKQRVKITSAIYDRGSVPAAEGTIEKNRWTDWLVQNGPHDVSFVAIPRFDSEQKYNTLFASGSAPDLLFEYSPWIRNTWYEQKQLLPLDDLIEQHSTVYKEMLEKYPELRKAGTMSDGKLYYLGRLNESIPNRAILIRKDWLDKLNLKVPETTEQLIEVAKAFAAQGNGIYGMAVSGSAGRTIDQMFQNMGFVVRDGQIEYAWDSTAEAAKFMKRLYDEGIIDRDFLSDTNGEKAKQDFVSGKIGIYPAQISWRTFAVNEYKTLKENDPEAELIPIPLPESPAGAFNPTFENPVQMTAAINRLAKHPEAVMEFADFLATPSTGTAMGYGIEGEHYEWNEQGCPVLLEGEQKQQVGYMGDARMLTSSTFATEGKCAFESQFNVNDPYEKEGLALFKLAKEAYFDLDRPFPEITLSEHMPQMPKELQITMGQTYKNIGDLYVKAIVSGPQYTVEQMIQDAQNVWAKGKGPEAEAWMKQWYAENKDTAFLAEDLYDIIRQQQGIK